MIEAINEDALASGQDVVAFERLYARLRPSWIKRRRKDVMQTKADEHEIEAMYDDVFMKATKEFDGRGNFENFFNTCLFNAKTDLQRKSIRKSNREIDIKLVKQDGNPGKRDCDDGGFDFDTIEDIFQMYDDETAISNVQKEREQRQLLSFFVDISDETTKRLIKEFPYHGNSWSTLGKAVGVSDKTAKSKITSLSKKYDGNRFGDYHDYFTVATDKFGK